MRRFVLSTVALCIATSVSAADVKVGNLSIDDVWARTGQPGQVSAAFMGVKNKGAADKIVSAHCDCAKADVADAAGTAAAGSATAVSYGRRLEL